MFIFKKQEIFSSEILFSLEKSLEKMSSIVLLMWNNRLPFFTTKNLEY